MNNFLDDFMHDREKHKLTLGQCFLWCLAGTFAGLVFVSLVWFM